MLPDHQATGTVLTEIERRLVGRMGPGHGNLVARNRLRQKLSASLHLSIVRVSDSERFKATPSHWVPRREVARDLFLYPLKPSLRLHPASNHLIYTSYRLSRLDCSAPVYLRVHHPCRNLPQMTDAKEVTNLCTTATSSELAQKSEVVVLRPCPKQCKVPRALEGSRVSKMTWAVCSPASEVVSVVLPPRQQEAQTPPLS